MIPYMDSMGSEGHWGTECSDSHSIQLQALSQSGPEWVFMFKQNSQKTSNNYVCQSGIFLNKSTATSPRRLPVYPVPPQQILGGKHEVLIRDLFSCRCCGLGVQPTCNKRGTTLWINLIYIFKYAWEAVVGSFFLFCEKQYPLVN